MNSAFHIIINEIRTKYAGKKASMLDVYDIESTYKISSFMNIRNDNCAFLRITSFGLDEIVFEDIVTNLAFIKRNFSQYEDLDFEIKKMLYNQAYGIVLEKDNNRFMDSSLHKASFDFKTDREEIIRLKKKCEELEKEIARSKGSRQQSLFDLLDEQ